MTVKDSKTVVIEAKETIVDLNKIGDYFKVSNAQERSMDKLVREALSEIGLDLYR